MTSEGSRGAHHHRVHGGQRSVQRLGRACRLGSARRLALIAIACGALAMPLALSPDAVHASGTAAAAPTAAPTPTTPSASAGITAVAATNSGVTITGSAAAGALVEIRSSGTWQTTDVAADSDPVGTTVAGASGEYSLTVPRIAPNGGDRIYDRFGAVVDGAPQGASQYVSDYRITSINDQPYPTSDTKKGLTVAQLTDDAEDLGIGHSLINVSINTLMVPAAKTDGSTIAFTSEGTTWYFDTARVESLDRKFRILTDDGIVPSAILKLDKPRSGTAVPELVHPDAVPGAVGGEQYMFNTATEQGVRTFTAAMEFMTQRWTRPDGRYGLVPNWIVGNEIDQAYKWMNMGRTPVENYVQTYGRALRIVDAAVHEAYGAGRTYVPLTNCWNDVCGTNPDPKNPTEYYAGRKIIDVLASQIKSQGDLDWGVAYHPYPADLFSPKVWDDPVTDDFDTARISPKNIEVLPKYLSQDRLTYHGRLRSIAATEWGCQTLSYRKVDLETAGRLFRLLGLPVPVHEGNRLVQLLPGPGL